MRIGVLSSDTELNGIILGELDGGAHQDAVVYVGESEQAIEYLNFEMPDLAIVNFSDEKVHARTIVEQIVGDTWLHTFGVIGLFDRKKDDEEALAESLKRLNVLNLFEHGRVRGNLAKTVGIIRDNRQVILQREISDRFTDTVTGSVSIDNDLLAVPSYVNLLAIYLASRGLVDEDTKTNLIIALRELILNGIEHGNCGISYEEKSAALTAGRDIMALVAERCTNPRIAATRVTLEYEIRHESSTFRVRDQGEGFDVRAYLATRSTREAGALLGRGIILARGLSRKLTYNAKGTEATLTFEHRAVDRASPQGFRGEEAVQFRKGDTVFREGESSSFIYYIQSGSFSVYHQGQHVGYVTPEDIFIGEMSFLLDNKRSATVRADEDGKLIRIPKKSFIIVIKRYPHYGIFLSRLIARKLARTNATTARYSIGEEE